MAGFGGFGGAAASPAPVRCGRARCAARAAAMKGCLLGAHGPAAAVLRRAAAPRRAARPGGCCGQPLRRCRRCLSFAPSRALTRPRPRAAAQTPGGFGFASPGAALRRAAPARRAPAPALFCFRLAPAAPRR
jgi:hypothetical protein